jgi:hypothetical protein
MNILVYGAGIIGTLSPDAAPAWWPKLYGEIDSYQAHRSKGEDRRRVRHRGRKLLLRAMADGRAATSACRTGTHCVV